MKPDKIFRRNILLATICCREKDREEGLLPAVRRYRSERIRRLQELAGEAGLPFAILSGLFGLLDAEEPIPYYDRLMAEDDIERISAAAAKFLKEGRIDEVIFCLPDPALDPHVGPYLRSMEKAAAAADSRLRIYFLPPYPPPAELISG